MNGFRYLQVLLLFAASGIFSSCKSTVKNWEIKGVADTASVVYLYRLTPVTTLVDSAQTDRGKFSFLGQNASEKMEPFGIGFKKNTKLGVECLLSNGDQIKIQVSKNYLPDFSGTPISADLNKYYSIKQQEQSLNLVLSEALGQAQLSDSDRTQEMITYREKLQNLENEKIQFLKSIVNPELNGYLVLKELQNSGVVEKEVAGKYKSALTAEGALTDNGIKVHRIYEFFDAYALSREINILDTATIRERYNKLSEEDKASDFARIVEHHLQKSSDK